MANPRRTSWRSLPLCLGVSLALHAGLLAAAAYVAVGVAGGRGGGGDEGSGSSSFTIRVRARGSEGERAQAEPMKVVPPAAEPVAPQVPEPTPPEAAPVAAENPPLPPQPAAEQLPTEANTHEAPSSGSGGGAGGGDGSGTGSHEGEGADGKGPAVRSTPAQLLSDPSPDYPADSIRRGEEGSVLCAMHVDEEGHVAEVEVLRSSGHPTLDRAAAEALRRWIFEPARADGKPVAARVLHQVVFRLN